MALPAFLANLRETGLSVFGLKPAGSTGPPVSGDYALGEIYLDSAGDYWRCSVAGNPGTWEALGGGAGGTPSATVADETTFGISPSAGVATAYSRGDHTHGSPTNPVTAHEGAGDPHPQYTTDAEVVVIARAAMPPALKVLMNDRFLM